MKLKDIKIGREYIWKEYPFYVGTNCYVLRTIKVLAYKKGHVKVLCIVDEGKGSTPEKWLFPNKLKEI